MEQNEKADELRLQSQLRARKYAINLQWVAVILLFVSPIAFLLFGIAPAVQMPTYNLTLYQITSDVGLSLRGSAISLLFFACLCVISWPYLLIGIFRKNTRKDLFPPFVLFGTLCALATLISASVLIAGIAYIGGEVVAGAAPILAMILSGIMLLNGTAYGIIVFHPRFDPFGLAFRHTKPFNFRKYITTAVFAVMVVSFFLFMLAPVYTPPLYTLKSDNFYIVLRQFSEKRETPILVDPGCALAIVIFLCLLAATVLLQFFALLAEDERLPFFCTAAETIISLVLMILSAVVIGQINKGNGFLQVGAGSVLLLIFSIVFLLYGVVTLCLPSGIKIWRKLVMHKCPNCNTEFKGNFCPECGKKWQEKKSCPQCGAKFPVGARFCNNCGHPLNETSAPARNESANGIPVAVRSKKNKKLAIVLSISLVIALVLAIVLPIYLTNRYNGTYYLYAYGQYFENDYFQLDGGKWTHGADHGTYHLNGDKITLYQAVFGGTEIANGTIKDGVMKISFMGVEMTYAKKGAAISTQESQAEIIAAPCISVCL